MENIQNEDIFYKTRDLCFIEKLMQVIWFNPKSWLLDEFRLKEGILTITCRNGNKMEAPFNQVVATYAVDNYGRHEYYLKLDTKKLHFKEIPGMLTDEEWDSIKKLLKPSLSGIGKLNDSLRSIKRTLKGQ